MIGVRGLEGAPDVELGANLLEEPSGQAKHRKRLAHVGPGGFTAGSSSRLVRDRPDRSPGRRRPRPMVLAGPIDPPGLGVDQPPLLRPG